MDKQSPYTSNDPGHPAHTSTTTPTVPAPEKAVPPPSPGPTSGPPANVDFLMNRLREEQNMTMAIVGGLLGAVAGAVAWAVVTYFTNFQIGFMAVGVGFLVAWLVRQLGKGIDQVYGVLGAVFSILGCVLGNILAGCAYVANELGTSFFEVLSGLNMSMSIEILKAMFSPIDLLFYALALYYGYKWSFRSELPPEVEKQLSPAKSGGTPQGS